MNITRRELIALSALAIAGCGSNETQKETERLKSLLSEAESVDESAYPKVWLEALAIEIEDAREVLDSDDSSWKDNNLAADALEKTMGAMVEKPYPDREAKELPPTKEIFSSPDGYVGGCFAFEATYTRAQQYVKNDSYDAEVTAFVKDGTVSTAIRLEHFPWVLSRITKYAQISVSGWLVDVGKKELSFIADTCEELEE